jgi:hypothetical protein
VQTPHELEHTLTSERQVVGLARHRVTGLSLALIDFPLQILGSKHGFALPLAQLVERDPQGHHAQPRVDTDGLPRELVEALDDLQVRHRQRLLGRSPRAEARQQHRSEKPRAVGAQQLSQRLAITRARAFAQPLLPSQLCAVWEDACGRRPARAFG